MKNIKLICIALCGAMLFSGCNMTDKQKGALIGTTAGGAAGTGLGAAIGALIGGKKGAKLGSAIGAGVGVAAGATAGTLIGKKMDKAKAAAAAVGNATTDTYTDANGLQGVKVTFDNGILFNVGKATLTTGAKSTLTKFANNVLKVYNDVNVNVYGFASSDGSDQLNLNLSNQRAQAVSTYLKSQGVPASQIVTTNGFGEDPDYLVYNADGSENQKASRRVEIYMYASEAMIEAAKRFAMPLQPFECDGAAEMRAELLPWLQGCDPAHAKMLVAVSYGRLIPQEVIAGADYSLNVHPSLLPRYKGSAPIQHTLLNGDTVTGVSLQTLHPEKFDHGEVIARTPEIPVNSLLDAAMDHIGAWKTRTLIDQLGTAGSLLLREVLLAGTYAKEDALDTSKYSSSWARTIKTADKQVDFARDTAEQVYNKLSVLGPVYAFKQVQVGKKRKSATEFTDKRVLIHEARPVDRAIGQDTRPGTFTLDQDNNTLLVECAGNTQLAVRSLQFEACAIETPTDFASRLRKRCGPIQAENCIFTTECTHESLQ